MISVQQHNYAATRVHFYVLQVDHHESLAVTLNLCLTNDAVVPQDLGLACDGVHWRREGE